MPFFNYARDERIREVRRRKLQGVVVDNNDPLQVQRVKVRIHDLHDDIADEDLPWFVPNHMSPYSGAADIGDHGPIPPKGTKIWSYFDDDTQYHGSYGAAVIVTSNKLSEFTKKQDSNNNEQEDFNNATGGDYQSAGYSGQSGGSKDTVLPDASKYKFYENYPHSHGHINATGSLHAKDQKTDVQTDMHVTSTGHAIDGKGNVFESVNGDTERKDNPDAKKIFPTGKTMVIKGDWTLYVSGKVNINTVGDTTIKTNGITSIESQKEIYLKAKGDRINLSCEKDIELKSKKKILFDAPEIKSSVPITLGAKVNYYEANKADTHDSPESRKRPNPSFPKDNKNY